MMSDRESRQWRLIRDRLTGFESREVSLARLTDDLHALILELQEIDEAGRNALLDEYWTLYAASHDVSDRLTTADSVRPEVDEVVQRLLAMVPPQFIEP